MLFYDIDLNAWVRKPGSNTPPWTTPVLTIGGEYNVEVQFVKGTKILDLGGGTFSAVIKGEGEYTATPIASNDAPYQSGTTQIVFLMNLDTTDAKAYFVANPTEDRQAAVLQLAYEIEGVAGVTVPFGIVIQNTYLVTA